MAGGSRAKVETFFGCPKCRYSVSGCERCKAADYKPTKDCILKRAAAQRPSERVIPKSPTIAVKPAASVTAAAVAPPRDVAKPSTRSRLDRLAAPPPSVLRSRRGGNANAAPEARQKPVRTPEPVAEAASPAAMFSPASRESSPKLRRTAKRSREVTPESPSLRKRRGTASLHQTRSRPPSVTPLVATPPPQAVKAVEPQQPDPAQPEAEPEPATQVSAVPHTEEVLVYAERTRAQASAVAAAESEPMEAARPQRGRVPSKRAVAAAEATPRVHRLLEMLPPRSTRGQKHDAMQPTSEHTAEESQAAMEQTPAAAPRSSEGGKASRSRRQQLHNEGMQARYLKDLKRYVEERGMELGAGWTVTLVERSSGTQAGGTDKYYHHPELLANRAACRSREDVVRLLLGPTSQSGASTPLTASGHCKRSKSGSRHGSAAVRGTAAGLESGAAAVKRGPLEALGLPAPEQQRDGSRQEGREIASGGAGAATTAVSGVVPGARPSRRAAAISAALHQQHQQEHEEGASEDGPGAAPRVFSRSGRLLKRSVAAVDTYQASSDEGGLGEEDSGGEWQARGHWRRSVMLPAPEVRSRSGRVLRRATAAVDPSEEDSDEWHEATDSDSGFEGGARRRTYPSAYDSGMLGTELQMMLRRMVPSHPHAESPQLPQMQQQQQQQQSLAEPVSAQGQDTCSAPPLSQPDLERIQEALSDHSGFLLEHSDAECAPEAAPAAAVVSAPPLTAPLPSQPLAGWPSTSVCRSSEEISACQQGSDALASSPTLKLPGDGAVPWRGPGGGTSDVRPAAVAAAPAELATRPPRPDCCAAGQPTGPAEEAAGGRCEEGRGELPELSEDLAEDAMLRVESSTLVQKFQLVRVVSGDSDAQGRPEAADGVLGAASAQSKLQAARGWAVQGAEPLEQLLGELPAGVSGQHPHEEGLEMQLPVTNGSAPEKPLISSGPGTPAKLLGASVGGAHSGGDMKSNFLTSLTENMAHRREERRLSAASGQPLAGIALLLDPKPTAAAKRAEARPAVVGDPRVAIYMPPASPYGLIEEQLYDNPWKLLLACILLHKTTASQVRKVIWGVMKRWPTANAMAKADDAELSSLIVQLGFGQKRAAMLKRFSREYATMDWHAPEELHGIGKYGGDAYYIFCRGEWAAVQPEDKDLLKYKQWMQSTGGEGSGLSRDPVPAP